jgi:hypothetical protein
MWARKGSVLTGISSIPEPRGIVILGTLFLEATLFIRELADVSGKPEWRNDMMKYRIPISPGMWYET